MVSFNKFYGKKSAGFCPNTENAFPQCFISKPPERPQNSPENCTRDF